MRQHISSACSTFSYMEDNLKQQEYTVMLLSFVLIRTYIRMTACKSERSAKQKLLCDVSSARGYCSISVSFQSQQK